MSADLAARLRTLAQDYHEGRINLAAYRTLRAPLLDSLVATVVPRVADTEITRPRAARPAPVAAEGASAEPEPTKRLPVGVIVGALGLVALAAALFWVFSGARAPAGDTSEIASGKSLASPVYELVVPFMERGDWSDAQLTHINASLLELGDRELGRAAPEPWFQRFVDELRRRLKEHQALAATPLTADNSAIAALAVTVGLDLNSPDAAIHIATVEEPPAAPDEKHATTPGAIRTEQPLENASAAHDAGSKPAPTAVKVSSIDPAERATSGASVDASAGTSVSPGTKAPAASSAAPVPATVATSHDGACRVELVRSRRPLCNDLLPTGEGPLLALVPAGSFEMGSAAADVEQPVHKVTISSPFAISVNEVSQAEFRQFCEHTRRSCAAQPWTGDDYPVVNVSWDDARSYVEWLSSVTHRRYRLPSEAQWEYAARAGQAGLVPGGEALSPTDAHFSMSTRQTAPARRSEKFKANGFRLLHTLGNVREWVDDAWVQTYAGAPADGSAVMAPSAGAGQRVARGGSYADGATRLRLSVREGLPEGTRDSFTGFRVVRELP
jgi:formylglycine-generating enzyme required for sulfatase activity